MWRNEIKKQYDQMIPIPEWVAVLWTPEPMGPQFHR